MLTSLILGMGVPTTANYVITSTIAAPALIQMDVPVLAAHMFVFYFGIVADITPPVALELTPVPVFPAATRCVPVSTLPNWLLRRSSFRTSLYCRLKF